MTTRNILILFATLIFIGGMWYVLTPHLAPTVPVQQNATPSTTSTASAAFDTNDNLDQALADLTIISN